MTTPSHSIDPAWVTRRLATYRRLLRLYPRDFRDEYSEDLVQGYRDLLVFSSSTQGLWWRTIRDTLSSATGEWRDHFDGGRGWTPGRVVAVLAVLGLLFVGGPPSLLSLFFLAAPLTFVGLPLYALTRFRRAWVSRRTTGTGAGRHVAVGLIALIPAPASVLWFGEDAGYWIFIGIAGGAIISATFGLLWAVVALLRGGGATGRRWVKPALVIVPCLAVLGFIIGASWNSYQNSLGPPGDHSVANASADTRALWEAAGRGDLAEVVRLTQETCADPWVKFPVGNGRHNAKGWAENSGRDFTGAVADHLGDYQNDWYDRCGGAD